MFNDEKFTRNKQEKLGGSIDTFVARSWKTRKSHCLIGWMVAIAIKFRKEYQVKKYIINKSRKKQVSFF